MSGEGRPEAGYPRLAGQPEAYLVRQLEAYADGRRKSAVMEPLARSLTAAERSRLARDFALRSASLSAASDRSSSPSYSARGKTLAVTGDSALRVQACQNCHGPLGRGQRPYGPSLAGLARDYLQAQLAAFRAGTRESDASGQMPAIARRLRDEDVAALAAYYAGLPVPGPREPKPPARFAAKQPPTRADVGREPPKGKGGEGSAATSGGAQGPAGGSGSNQR